MVSDVAYIFTWEGWLYLATVIDCATRGSVGWAMDDEYKTPLITSAMRMPARYAILPEGAVFHSDRGSTIPRPSSRVSWKRSASAGQWAGLDL